MEDKKITPEASENRESEGGTKGDNGGAKKKKTVLIVFAVILALAVLLIMLNMIDFDAILKRIREGSSDDGRGKNDSDPVVTVDPGFLAEPDYDEDIMLDKDYLKENIYLHFTYGAETFEILDRSNSYNDVCRLFYDYFDALKKGDISAFYSLFTDDYLKENEKKNFTAQKIYNINVKCIGSSYLENGDANGRYKGYTVYYCDVQYNIKDNNGTFRNDFYGDDSTLPLVFEVVERNGNAKISDVSYYQTSPGGAGSSEKENSPVSVMFFVWLGAFVLAAVLAPVTGKPGMLGAAASALVSMFLTFLIDLIGIVWLSVILQILVFAGLSALIWLLIDKAITARKNRIGRSEK